MIRHLELGLSVGRCTRLLNLSPPVGGSEATMIRLNFPRYSSKKEPWHVVSTEYDPFLVRYRDTSSYKTLENPSTTAQKVSFKWLLARGDHVTPTTYGRLTFSNGASGVAHQDYSVGGWRGTKPVRYSSLNGLGPPSDYWSEMLATNCRLGANINDENRLMSELLSKFVSSPLQLDQSLAELDKTANYLAHGVNNLAGGLIAIKTGSRRRGKKLLRDAKTVLNRLRKSDVPSKVAMAKRWAKRVPSTWKASGSVAKRFLEYKFAILPLAYDVAGLSEIASDGLNPDPRYVEDIGLLSVGHAVVIGSKVSTETQTQKLNIMADQVYYARIRATIHDPQLYGLSLLGLVNLPVAAWERLTLSWLVDYVIPIGTFLRATMATVGLRFHSGYKGLSLTAVGTFAMKFPNHVWGTQSRGIVSGFERNKLTSFPTPLPYTKSPFTINENQFANVVALIRTFFK